MGNPYEILGVKESATDEEIKAAYKVLVKKYHPDRHANNPLEDLAEEKLRQVNMAYDEINDIRNGKSQNAYGGASGAAGYGAYGGRRNTTQTASTKRQPNCSGYKPGRPNGFFWMA
jgi:molecular chaperone DnaJ